MPDVCLVTMPYAGVERPSLALGLLKAGLTARGIAAKCLYANISFAEEIGLYHYGFISNDLVGIFLSDWTFAGAAFPEFNPDHTDYFQTIDYTDPEHVRQLWSVRHQAAPFIQRVAEQVLALNPRIVSCSSTFFQHCASIALLRRIRELDPKVITVMGGAHCEGPMGWATHQAFDWVDYVCSGEGDDNFPELCERLLQHGHLTAAELPYGVVGPSERQTSLATRTIPRASIASLDQLPIPDFEEYFETLEQSLLRRYVDPGLPLETSRGCWWGQKHHCTFCGLNGEGMGYRSKRPERVLYEMGQLTERYGLRKLFVVDNILDWTFLETVLPVLVHQTPPYSIFYELKANLKYHHVQLLHDAGVRWIQPGIESLEDRVLQLMRKGTSALVNVQLLKWSCQFGIWVFWNFLIGIPGESAPWYRDLMGWLPLIAHLHPPISFIQIRGDRFSPYHEQAEDYGLALQPNRAYKYIYPLSDELLNDFAYYFEDWGPQSGRQLTHVVGWKPPIHLTEDHETLQDYIKVWQRQFWSNQRPQLTIVEDSGEDLHITDTRSCRVQESWILEGIDTAVYRVCNQALTCREIQRALVTHYEIQCSLDEIESRIQVLSAARLVLRLNAKVLSLAVQSPITPLPDLKDHPAGYVNIHRYIHDMRSPLQAGRPLKVVS